MQGAQDSIPRQATGSHMPQLKISNAVTETQSSQINIKKEKEFVFKSMQF